MAFEAGRQAAISHGSGQVWFPAQHFRSRRRRRNRDFVGPRPGYGAPLGTTTRVYLVERSRMLLGVWSHAQAGDTCGPRESHVP